MLRSIGRADGVRCVLGVNSIDKAHTEVTFEKFRRLLKLPDAGGPKAGNKLFKCFFFWHVLIQRTQRVSHTRSIHRLVCSDSKCKRKDAYYIRLRAFSWCVALLVDRPRDKESDGVALGRVQSRKPRRTDLPSIPGLPACPPYRPCSQQAPAYPRATLPNKFNNAIASSSRRLASFPLGKNTSWLCDIASFQPRSPL